jgi:beta-lactamase class A
LLDAGGRAWLEQRAGERFPMCSTFKWLLAGQVLARVDAGDESLARVVPYGEADLLEYAPVTRANVDRGGLTIEELCDAAVRRSDNTAANLLVATVGGPPGFTRYARALGDEVTRLDRLEPQLNAAEPGDSRDTTTPAAMAANLRRVLLGDALSDGSRERLIGWMIASTTGATKLRAGFPDDWRAGDKSGMGARGATNDVAIAWPPGRPPVLIAAYLVESDAPVEVRNAALADVGRIVGRMIDGDP